MNVVFASHSPFSRYLVVGSHHLSREMANAGHTVLHIGPPITPFHLLRLSHGEYRNRLVKSLKGLELLQDNLFSLEPISAVPWQLAKWAISCSNLFIQASNITRIVNQAGVRNPIDFLVVDDPRFAGLEKLLKPRALFYRPTDLYAKMKMDSSLLTAESLLLSQCNGVIATSLPVLHHALSLKPGLFSLLMENGVDYRHFSTPVTEPDELKDIPHPRVIYVGAIDERFDDSTLLNLANRMQDFHFIVIGPGSKLAALQKMQKSNLHVLGPKPYERIPGFLQFSDIGLLPLVNSTVNSGRSPMKLYEYGAAGLPMVSSRTPELTRRQENFMHLFSSLDEAMEQLKKLQREPMNRQQIAESCRRHSWAEKASRLVQFMTEVSTKNS